MAPHSRLDLCCEIFPIQSQKPTRYSWPQAALLRVGPLSGNITAHKTQGDFSLCLLVYYDGYYKGHEWTVT